MSKHRCRPQFEPHLVKHILQIECCSAIDLTRFCAEGHFLIFNKLGPDRLLAFLFQGAITLQDNHKLNHLRLASRSSHRSVCAIHRHRAAPSGSRLASALLANHAASSSAPRKADRHCRTVDCRFHSKGLVAQIFNVDLSPFRWFLGLPFGRLPAARAEVPM